MRRKAWLLPLLAATALACNALLGIDGDVIEGAGDAGGADAAPLPGPDGGSSDGDEGGYSIAPIGTLRVVQNNDVELDVTVNGPTQGVVAITLTPPPGVKVTSGPASTIVGTAAHFKLHADTFAVQGALSLGVTALAATVTLTRDVPLEITGPFDTTFGDGGLVLIPFRGNPTTNSTGMITSDVGLAVNDAGIYVAFSTSAVVGNAEAFALKRLTPDGKDDPTFANGGIDRAWPLAVGDDARAHAAVALSDGGVLVIGEAHPRDGGASAASYTGVVWGTDAGFAIDGGGNNTSLRSLAAVGDVAYAAGGGVGNSNTVLKIVNGAVDPTFGGPFGALDSRVKGLRYHDVKVAPDGAVLVFGQTCGVATVNGCNAIGLRFLDTGNLDTSFGDGGIARTADPLTQTYGFGGAVLDDGGIFVLGASGGAPDAGGDPTDQRGAVARLDGLGHAVTTFGSNGAFELTGFTASRFYGAAVMPDGSLVLAGAATDPELAQTRAVGDLGNVLVKINPAGAIDTSFGQNGIARVPLAPTASQFRRLAAQDGKLIAVGLRITPTTTARLDAVLVRLLP